MTRTLAKLALSMTLLALSACGGGGTTTMMDLSVATVQDMTAAGADMVVQSRCGRPGDTGNNNGVGKYCSGFDDCKGQMANICSLLGNDPDHPENDTFFCTYTCSSTSPAGYCGDNATCQCESLGCACAPDRCGGATDGGSKG